MIGNVATSQQLLQDALSAAQNANDESTALRYLGYLEIRTGTTPQTRKEGEELFSRAMSLDKKYNLQYSSYQANFLRAAAAFDWANAIAPFDCGAAQKHFDDGVKNLIANPRTPEMVQMRRLALPVYKDGFNGSQGCKPSPQTVLAP